MEPEKYGFTGYLNLHSRRYIFKPPDLRHFRYAADTGVHYMGLLIPYAGILVISFHSFKPTKYATHHSDIQALHIEII